MVAAQQSGKLNLFILNLADLDLASFNFDTRFGKKQDGLGMRVGFGGFSLDGSGVVFFPVGLNYLIGKDTTRITLKLEQSITPLIATEDFTNDGGTFTSTFGHLNFGYRYQPPTSGFTFPCIVQYSGDLGFPYYEVSFEL